MARYPHKLLFLSNCAARDHVIAGRFVRPRRLQRKTAPSGVQTFASAVCDLRAMLAAKSLSLQRDLLPPAGRARALHSGGEGNRAAFSISNFAGTNPGCDR